ncbi:hypothetical protein ACFVZA_10390 [Streptomyces bottropensis]|uniref:hypothetical protein n=1 Tax=Streptomyces bottropensis TaxID=42235 RepID=UPI0036AEC0CF
MVRECREELGIEAVASPITGERPLFLTVTRTRGPARAHRRLALVPPHRAGGAHPRQQPQRPPLAGTGNQRVRQGLPHPIPAEDA